MWAKGQKDKQSAAKETFETKVAKLRNTEPKDLLRQHVKDGISEALKEREKANKKSKQKKVGGSANGQVDDSQAYTNALMGKDVLESIEYIAPPPGLKPDFRVDGKWKPPEKNDKADKGGEGKRKSKSKSKDQPSCTNCPW